MRITLFIFSFLFTSVLFSQQAIQVEVKGNIFNCKEKTVSISQSFKGVYTSYLTGKRDKKGNFLIKGTLPAPDYYVLRIGQQNIQLILRDQAKITINADGKNPAFFNNISGSDESIPLNEYVAQQSEFQRKKDSVQTFIKKYPDQEQAALKSFQMEQLKFSYYRQKFIGEHPNAPALLPAILSLDPEKEFSTYESGIQQLNMCFPDSPTVQAATKNYLERKRKIEASNPLLSGKPAPNFTQNDVNGKPVSLSDFKGKVVLIDFWASWCGPCRKENPNVVKLYEKYKNAGFTILSVSLDDNKERWQAAIEQDKLTWPNHVCDFKKWANDAARTYQVQGIPFTVLVDKEGKIIQTKLRGAELERKLIELFGF